MTPLPFGHYSYFWILLLWATPVFALQWAAAWRELWRCRRVLLATFLLCGTYLALSDHFAIAHGIWQIQDDGVIGWRLQGHLPLEEAMFFYLTVLMSAQGFVMIAGYFKKKAKGRTKDG